MNAGACPPRRSGLWTDRATGDGGDIFCLIAGHLALRVRVRARLMEGFDIPCQLRQTEREKRTEHMNRTILALDLGTTTGWALHHLDGSIISGTECFKPQRFEGGGMRFLRFKRWLNELLSASHSINAVYFEDRTGLAT